VQQEQHGQQRHGDFMTLVVFNRDSTAPTTLAKGSISLADTGSNTAAMYVGNNTNVPVRVLGATAQLQVSSTGAQAIPTAFPVNKTFTFTAQPNLQWSIGTRVRASFDSTHYMEGTISSYTSTSLVVSVDRAIGTGTLSGWSIGLVGDVGATGTTGATGATGAGVPVGGATGAMMTKNSATDYDTAWRLDTGLMSACTVSVPLRTTGGITDYAMAMSTPNTLGATVNGSGYWVCPYTGIYDIYTEGRPNLDNQGGIYGFLQHNITTTANAVIVQGESNFPVNGTIGLLCKAVSIGVSLTAATAYKFRFDHYSNGGNVSAHTVTVRFVLRR
jgi:hypothetical protein